MAEIITIEDKQVQLRDGASDVHTMPVEAFVKGVSDSTLHGMTDEPIPDSTKWLVRCASLVVCILQLTPELRWMKWLADNSPQPYGPEAVYTDRRLATPYVILKVPFWGRRLLPRIELFYRNQALTTLDGEGGALYWPNLYNVSVNAYNCTAWYCSQYLRERRTLVGIAEGCDAVVHDFAGGKFNASSEHHEGLSTFGLCAQQRVDPRVTDVARWEAESQRDPKFVLGVKWKSTGLTVKGLLERELAFSRVAPLAQNAQALGNILLRKPKAK